MTKERAERKYKSRMKKKSRNLLHICLLYPNHKTYGQNIYRIDAY